MQCLHGMDMLPMKFVFIVNVAILALLALNAMLALNFAMLAVNAVDFVICEGIVELNVFHRFNCYDHHTPPVAQNYRN